MTTIISSNETSNLCDARRRKKQLEEKLLDHRSVVHGAEIVKILKIAEEESISLPREERSLA